ncbi:MAG: S9 family peptidase [Pseudomonadota bacterium]
MFLVATRLLTLLSLAIAAVAIIADTPPALAQGAVPLSEYGKLPEVERTAISPSGRRVALLTTIKGSRVILMIEDQTTLLSTVEVGDVKVQSIRWVGEDRVLMINRQTQRLSNLFTTNKAELNTGRVIPVDENDKGGVIFANRPQILEVIAGNYGVREIDGKYYGFYSGYELVKRNGSRAEYVFGHGRPFLYRVDLESLKTQIASAPPRPGFLKDWLIGADGSVVATLNAAWDSGKWSVRNANGDVVLEGQTPDARVSLVGLGADGTTFIMSDRVGDLEFEWYEASLAGGETRQVFLESENVGRIFFDGQTGHYLGFQTSGEDPSLTFVNEKLNQTAQRIARTFKAFRTRLTAWSEDYDTVIVRTSGNKDSGTYYSVDLANGKAGAIAYERLAIGPPEVGAISTFEYTASDGTELDGILTLPPGSDGGNLPVVVLPHGGPHAHDTTRFDWWGQAFASRGYAVFQPNFRGSTNRDDAFMRAGFGEYGRKMQTDKSDGLMALAEAGIVDPDRACIVGASYGGYAALVGVTIQQDLYKCAVAVAPLSDLRDRYNYRYRSTGRARSRRADLLEQMGDPKLWDQYSPLKHAEKADAPIMLIHGKDDTVVPFSHSSKMADALKDAGKPYELVTLAGEDHWLSLSETRMQMLENSVRWVEKYNPVD